MASILLSPFSWAAEKNNLSVSAPSSESPLSDKERARQISDLRFGMFICWSLSTFSQREWTPGVKDINKGFPAKTVDTDQWARTARDAGMKYILFLAKHHDGFCLWDTKTTDRKVTNAPLGKDVLKQLKTSCDKYGIKLALYFSEGDWTWPGAKDGLGGGSGIDAEKEKSQLTELLTRYGPIEFMWVDHAAGTGGLTHQEFLDYCRKLQPDCWIGFNHGDQKGCKIRLGEMGGAGSLDDMKSAGPYASKDKSDDYKVAEFTYPILPEHKGGAMWFYSLPEHDNLCLSVDKIHSEYVKACKFGNIFSLNVGPDYEGKIRSIDVKTLKKVGEMIRKVASAKQAALGK